MKYRIDVAAAAGPPLTLAIRLAEPGGFSGGDIPELRFDTIDSLKSYLRDRIGLPGDAISEICASLDRGTVYAEQKPLDAAAVSQFREDVEAQSAS
jgi:hypothetical protein